MRLSIFVFFIALSSSIFAQKGNVTFHGDSLINSAIHSHIAINKKKCPQLIKGYRVQISSANGADARTKTSADRMKFLALFPDVNTHELWEAPSYKVRVGDCRTKFEAEQLKKQVQANFPFCFVVPDYIDTYYIQSCK
jgi:hypothetical protein